MANNVWLFIEVKLRTRNNRYTTTSGQLEVIGAPLRRSRRNAWHARACVGLAMLVTVASVNADEPEATPTASVKLAALGATFIPGHTFTLTLDLNVPQGWHTYWLNPGETGMAPDFKWDLPQGVTLSALHFPVPQRYDDDGTISLGYTGTVRLVADFIAEADVTETMTISLTAVWMICRDICLPLTSRTSLTLEPSAASASPPRVSAAQTIAQKRLPQLDDAWKVTVHRGEKDLMSIRITPPAAVKLPAAAWQKAWLFFLERDVIDLSTAPRWQPTETGWIAQVKPGLKTHPPGAPWAFVLAFPTLSDMGWQLQGVVEQPDKLHP